MFFRKNKIEVVPVNELTDYSERFKEFEKMREADRKQYATRKTVAFAATVPATASIGLAAYTHYLNSQTATTSLYVTPPTTEPVNVLSTQFYETAAVIEPSTLTETFTPIAVNAIPQQTGIIADTSLEMLATVLDPVIQILVAISFPIASVIMVGACFFFMIGNTERAWSMIMNAGLGYVLIQLSPLFLEILKTVGEAL